jgi:hypothetical protein
MSCQFDFDPRNRILRCRLKGHITDDVLKEYYRDVAAYAAQTDPSGGVMDMSAVTSFEVSAQTVRELARSAPALPDPNHVRVIVAPTDHIFGIARLFQFEGDSMRPNLHVVRTLLETWVLLGVQNPRFEPLQAK